MNISQRFVDAYDTSDSGPNVIDALIVQSAVKSLMRQRQAQELRDTLELALMRKGLPVRLPKRFYRLT